VGQDASQIRTEIEATRSRMGDTVDAIGYKADVPARVRDDLNDRIETVKGTIGNALAGSKKAARDSTEALRDTASGASMNLQNPLGLALGALAIGFLGGLLLPSSAIERERIGPLGDEIAGRLKDTADEVVDAGKTIMNETLATATESVQQHGGDVVRNAMAGTPLAQANSGGPPL
jgi:hypothetical protein